MTCECGAKMKCTFSVPRGNFRYRNHRCRFCKVELETLEMPINLVTDGNIKKVIRGQQRRRFAFYKTMKANS